MYPQLRADQTSADFPGAQYVNKVRASNNVAEVTNRLVNAQGLASLIEAGRAKWSIEVRSPAALYSRTFLTNQSVKTVKWEPQETGPEVFIISGLVVVEGLVLPTDQLNPAWHAERPLNIPVGALLARGMIARTKPVVSSMLRFTKKENLARGRMEISDHDEQFQFNVNVSPELFARCTKRDVQIAALIGVMGKLPKTAESFDEGVEPLVLRAIREMLEEGDVPTWENPEDYDAALAATALEPFVVEEEMEEEED